MFTKPKFNNKIQDILKKELAIVSNSSLPIKEIVINNTASANTSTPIEPIVKELVPKYILLFLI